MLRSQADCAFQLGRVNWTHETRRFTAEAVPQIADASHEY